MKDCTFKLNGTNIAQQYIDNYASLSCNAMVYNTNNITSMDFVNYNNFTMNKWFELTEDAMTYVENVNGDGYKHFYFHTGMHAMDTGTTYNSKEVWRYFHSLGTKDVNGAPQEIDCTNGTPTTIAFKFNHHVNANATYYLKLHVWRGQDPFGTKYATVTYAYNNYTIDTWYDASLQFTPNTSETYYYMIELSRQYDSTYNYTDITEPTITI